MKIQTIIISIISIIMIVIIFIMGFILSDFYIDDENFRVCNKYYVVDVNGEYNLMYKQESGYSLVVPSVSDVYLYQKQIIVISDLDGSSFINNNYKYKIRDKYYYSIINYKVEEISEKEFSDKKNRYHLVWKNQ